MVNITSLRGKAKCRTCCTTSTRPRPQATCKWWHPAYGPQRFTARQSGWRINASTLRWHVRFVTWCIFTSRSDVRHPLRRAWLQPHRRRARWTHLRMDTQPVAVMHILRLPRLPRLPPRRWKYCGRPTVLRCVGRVPITSLEGTRDPRQK